MTPEEAQALHEQGLYFKVFEKNGMSLYGYKKYTFPKGGKPGGWLQKQTPVLCESGYHVFTWEHFEFWMRQCGDNGCVWVVEARGSEAAPTAWYADKRAFEQIRLIRPLKYTEATSDDRIRLFMQNNFKRPTKLTRLVEELLKERARKRPRKAVVAALKKDIAVLRYNYGDSYTLQRMIRVIDRGSVRFSGPTLAEFS